MPFKNIAQMKAMFAKAPKVAKRWMKKYGMPPDDHDFEEDEPKKKSKKKSKVKYRGKG